MKSNQSFVYELAAAGLLHDIGKVLQPAKIPLSAEAGKLEQMICPVFNGNYSHKHVLYTAHALYEMESNYGRLDRSRIERVAIYHHRPNTDQLDENLLTKADWLASGHDRQSSLEEEERTGLIPIVSTLSLAGEKQQGRETTENEMLSTSALDFAEEAYLPVAKQSRTDYQERCQLLSSQVLSALNRDYGSPEECLESLLGVTQGLLHTVPASRYRGHVTDVSLFDHSRMVAALAACLGMQEHENGNNANQIKGRFRFVTLGMGGIQNFIFRSVPPLEPADSPANQSVNKGSAKRLRARSFYISLFSWIAARRILNELGLPSTNLVYDAGGHALLLIPEMSEVVELVNQVLAQIAAEIRDTLGGTLRFDYALSEPLLESDFHPSKFQTQLRKIETARANARLRFPDDRLRDGQSWAENGWIDNSDVSLVIDRAPFLKQLKLLGQVLPKSEFLALNSGDRADWSEDLLGMRVSLHTERPASGLVYSLKPQAAGHATPLFLSGSHLPVATEQELQRLETLQAVFDEEEPLQAGAPLPFHALAHLSTSDEGTPVKHPMLGVLKADVDLLGALFSYGFCSNPASAGGDASSRATLGRLAALSRSLDQFFKGFLIEKIRTHYRNLYTVFVGGDDLFLIGPWYDLVRFTRDLHGWFTRMTCQNQDVTFSAGIIFSKPATPVVHLADQAEAVLEEAKSRGRNRIAYGNVTLTWEQYQRAFELHQLLVSCISTSADSRGVNPSMIYRLLKYSQQAMKCGLSVNEGGQAVKPSFAEMKWRAQLSYDLKRNLPHPTTETPQIQKFQEALMQIISPTDDAPVLYTAASLTLYFIRGESK